MKRTLLLTGLILLTACSVVRPPAPTATPVPPSATPAPPTPTAIPSNTAEPPTAVPSDTPAPTDTSTPAPTDTPTPPPTPAPSPTPPPTPSPTPATGADIEVLSVTVTAPQTATAGVAFLATGMVGLHNNGPDGPVNVDTTLTIHLPANCTITNGATVLVPNRSAPVGVGISVSRAWNVTCTQAGAHQFTIDASVVISPGQLFTDPNTANNSGSGSASTQVN